jgi:hypothetical protein
MQLAEMPLSASPRRWLNLIDAFSFELFADYWGFGRLKNRSKTFDSNSSIR